MARRIEPQVGQESVWDYPRPPRLEATKKRLRVVFNGITIADTVNGYRVLETSHPPVYYIPQADIRMEHLLATSRNTYCEWKGGAIYYSIEVGKRSIEDAAWSYQEPNYSFRAIKDHIAFYAGMMDACYVDDELVTPQPGGFYGGWITKDIVGPFKGSPGTWGW